MRLITAEDDTLFESSGLAAKLGMSDRLLEHLYQRYAAAGYAADAGFTYALAQVAALQGARSDFELHAAFSATTETLGDVLEAAPDHWLARYLRARLRALVPARYGDVNVYLDIERMRALKDLAVLLEQQRSVAAHSYFGAAYLLYAQALLAESEEEHALSLIREAGEALPRRAVPFSALATILCEPFRNVHQRLDPNTQRGAAKTVEALMRSLFPAEPGVAAPAATADRAARD